MEADNAGTQSTCLWRSFQYEISIANLQCELSMWITRAFRHWTSVSTDKDSLGFRSKLSRLERFSSCAIRATESVQQCKHVNRVYRKSKSAIRNCMIRDKSTRRTFRSEFHTVWNLPFLAYDSVISAGRTHSQGSVSQCAHRKIETVCLATLSDNYNSTGYTHLIRRAATQAVRTAVARNGLRWRADERTADSNSQAGIWSELQVLYRLPLQSWMLPPGAANDRTRQNCRIK